MELPERPHDGLASRSHAVFVRRYPWKGYERNEDRPVVRQVFAWLCVSQSPSLPLLSTHTHTHTHPPPLPPLHPSSTPPTHPPTHQHTILGSRNLRSLRRIGTHLQSACAGEEYREGSREEPSQCWWQGQHVVHVEPTSRVWKLWKDSFQRVSETLMRHAGVASSALPGVLLWFVLESLEWPSQPYRSLHPIDSCSVRSDTGNGGKILTGQARVRCPTHLNDGSLNQNTGKVCHLRVAILADAMMDRQEPLLFPPAGAANSKLQGCRSQKDACAFERSLFVKKKS